jgi:hypothetical protein
MREARPVHRPPRYGRGLVVPVEGGLLDIKGAGVGPGVTPTIAGAADGLLYLEKALADHVVQQFIDEIFRVTKSRFRSDGMECFYGGKPIDIYAPETIADFSSRAGLDRNLTFDCVNIQTARIEDPNAEVWLVDFGQYRIRTKFDLPVLSLVSDRPLRWGGA